MRIIDITQELFTSNVYPGDKPPSYERIMQIKNGDVINLTTIEMCVHNGTHIDAPCHFIDNGKSIDEMDLEIFVGECTVVSLDGEVGGREMAEILKKCKPRLLIKGRINLTTGAAEAMVEGGLKLIGVESQSVGPVDAPKAVHMVLLGHDVTALEGLDLSLVSDGDYFLCAAPLNLGKSDGSPCRAILLDGWTQNI